MSENPVETTVDVLFLVSVLVNLIKSGDMLLREHHKKRIQSSLEAITVYLDDLRPLSWFQNIASERYVTAFVLISLPLAAYGLLLTYSEGLALWEAWFGGAINQTLLLVVRWIAYLCVVIGSLILLVVGGVATRVIADWLLGEDLSFRLFLRRFAIFAIAGGAAVMFIHFFLSSLTYLIYARSLGKIEEGTGWLSFVFSRVGLASIALGSEGVIAIYLAYAMPLVVAACIILSQILLLSIEIIVGAARGICWRIVEHNRGAWSAIVMLATLILGVIELRLKGIA